MATTEEKLLPKATAQEAANILSGFKRTLGAEGFEIPDTADTEVNAYYRNSEFFNSRCGVEDDDHPNFTGHDAIEKKIASALHLFSNVFEIEDEEKSWFTVRIYL